MKNCCFSSPKPFATHFIGLKMPFVIRDNRANRSICPGRDYFNYGLNVLFSASVPQRISYCWMRGVMMHIKTYKSNKRGCKSETRTPIETSVLYSLAKKITLNSVMVTF